MKYKSNKIVTAILAILLVLVIGGAAALVGVLSDGFKDWTKFQPDEQTEQTDETADNGGAIINAPVENGVKFMFAKIPVAEYAVNGISEQAESAYMLTATLDPAGTDNNAVDWSVEFVNPSSSWASGKTVTDYVTVTPTADGALTANAECKKAFGEQIKVVVTSRANTEAKAECTFDYARRITDYALNIEVGEEGSNTKYGTFIDFGENEALIDFAAVSYSEALNGSEYYDGSEVWGSRVLSMVMSLGTFFDDDDLNDPLFAASDTSEKLNAQFSDYTIKDNMLFENNVNSELCADIEFTVTLNSEVQSIVNDYFCSCGKNGIIVTPVEIFGSSNYVGSNFLTIWKYSCDSFGPFDLSKVESLYNDFIIDLVTWLKANPDTPVWTFDFTITGKYSTFEKTFTVRYDPATVQMPVFGVSLDNSNLVF